MQTETVNPDEYNGWVNKETWAAALHLSNDESLYNECRQIVETADNIYGAADQLHAWINEEMDRLHYPDDTDYPVPEWVRLMASDVGSLWRVDWIAVAESFAE